MGRYVDTLITYRILRKLVTPFEETNAYRLGIIDSTGKQLIKDRDLNTEQREAFTILDRMIFRLKRIIQKVPGDNKRIVTFAAALSLVKEHINDTVEPLSLEKEFVKHRASALDLQETSDFLLERSMKTFKMFAEDGIANSVGAGFVNQANPNGNPNLQGPDILMRKRILRRKKIVK